VFIYSYFILFYLVEVLFAPVEYLIEDVLIVGVVETTQFVFGSQRRGIDDF
jgi:hypothetical protein